MNEYRTVSTRWKFEYDLQSTFWVTSFQKVPELQRMCDWEAATYILINLDISKH